MALDDCVTALMPVKNYHPRFLREALASVFAQTSSRWRLIVIVEPPVDAKMAEILSGARHDSRVRVTDNQGLGLAGAFNTGMRAAQTDFVATLLSDDLWTANATELLTSRIRACPEVDLHHSALRVIDEDGRPISAVRHPPRQVSLDDFVMGSPVKHLICWRRAKGLSFGGMHESIEAIGPDDYDFPWTMLEHGAVIRALDACLYLYRDHREAYRITTHLPRSAQLRSLRRIFQRHGVPAHVARKRLRDARRVYLRQCLYRNRFDRWLREKIIGIDPERGWRLPMEWTTGDRRATDEPSGAEE
ncbi:MAG TPA: glycosyltransferase [Candidatus Binataceae bacterium]|nr:glycosyltransferase [Candidatus Binataceae bacterium]